MSLTRRAALRMGGGLGLGSFLAGGPAKAVPSLIPAGVPNDDCATEPSRERNWNLFRRFEQDHIDWRSLHESGIDPDLRGMRSLSPTIRLLIQRRRNSERRDTVSRVRKILGME